VLREIGRISERALINEKCESTAYFLELVSSLVDSLTRYTGLTSMFVNS
jgi:hypothetical protein